MKAKYMMIAAALLALPAAAQETYENTKLVGNDLNGTARYVGMGGAMEALGADISTISSNPAGIGLFRHSTFNVSGGLLFQGDVPSYTDGSKTHASFDQAGFVYSVRTRKNSFLNFAFNYSKNKNFDFILGATGALNNASSNKLTYQKMRNGVFDNGDGAYSQVDYLNVNYFNMKQDSANYAASEYGLSREQSGYIGNYDFNISGNIHDRVYLGVTFGIKDVHYTHGGWYDEVLNGNTIEYTDHRHIHGTGFDVTLGAIVRPFETSPFRIGVYVKTPTWYDLTTENYSTIGDGKTQYAVNDYDPNNVYDYKITTPWKFGVSLGHTVGNYLALGATYEYEDYGSMKSRINDGVAYDYYYDGWDGYYDGYETSHKDRAMNKHTEETLKGVSTLKLGIEYKPVKDFAIRLGYNYVSPMFEESGVKGFLKNGNPVYSNGTYYNSTSDYTNWKSTNRFTCGLGYTVQKWNFDLAYQYSCQKGDFYPFASYYEAGTTSSPEDNIATATEVKNNRSQLLLTIGYHF